jgi:purine-binding chemotaxis protein CheW
VIDSAQRLTAADRLQTLEETSSLESDQTQAASSSSIRAAIISLGGTLFTIDLKNVREVFIVESITPIPGMPSGLVGVTNLRGTVIPLLDLRPMFGLSAETALRYAVLVQHGNRQVGVLVDSVPEIRAIAKAEFLPAPAGTGEGAVPFVSTVVKLEDRFRGVLETSILLSHFEGSN